MKTLFVIGLLLVSGIARAGASVDADAVREWVSYLAADDLRGRRNGTREITQASRWIAEHFSAAGLLPVPGHESYFQVYATEEAIPYRNVIGYLPGSDPDLADEHIILSAHYDHIGQKDTEVFNGADDDASGVSAVIGLAYQLAAMKPRRSILFVTWSGEELGLLGSKFYVSHPLLPLENAVLNLNFEMVGHTEGQGKRQFWVTGAEHSTLFEKLRRIPDADGWQVGASPFPEMQLFWRSDNASFVRLVSDETTRTVYGIPAHSISTWGREGHYHSATDNAETLDYVNLAALIRLFGRIVNDLSDQEEVVQWKDNARVRLRAYKDRP